MTSRHTEPDLLKEIRKEEKGKEHLHLVNVGMVDLVAEADGRRLEGILVRQVYLDLPCTLCKMVNKIAV